MIKCTLTVFGLTVVAMFISHNERGSCVTLEYCLSTLEVSSLAFQLIISSCDILGSSESISQRPVSLPTYDRMIHLQELSS